MIARWQARWRRIDWRLVRAFAAGFIWAMIALSLIEWWRLPAPRVDDDVLCQSAGFPVCESFERRPFDVRDRSTWPPVPPPRIDPRTGRALDLDSDDDGVRDGDDPCPAHAGPAQNAGCPWHLWVVR